MKVKIPARKDHAGIHFILAQIADHCPQCGATRGKPFKHFSYDGSRRLVVDCWKNPCGHIDYYEDVRKEAEILKFT